MIFLKHCFFEQDPKNAPTIIPKSSQKPTKIEPKPSKNGNKSFEKCKMIYVFPKCALDSPKKRSRTEKLAPETPRHKPRDPPGPRDTPPGPPRDPPPPQPSNAGSNDSVKRRPATSFHLVSLHLNFTTPRKATSNAPHLAKSFRLHHAFW